MLTLPNVSIESLNVQAIDWCGLPKRFLWPGELEAIITLVRSVNARNVLEIGCNTGRTAKAILHNVPTVEHYQGIDVPPGYQFAKDVQKNEVPEQPGQYALDDPRFELLLSARGSFDFNAAQLRAADVVFIDGDHGRAAIEHDTHLARQILRPGGMIIWHDYHDLGTVDVRDVLHQFAAAGAGVVHVAGTWLAFERVSGAVE